MGQFNTGLMVVFLNSEFEYSYISIFLLIGVLIVLFWLFFNIYCLKKYKVDNKLINQPGVSILISYKDAGQHIEKTVHCLLEQDYGNFEIIAVDDFSSDDGYQRLLKIKDQRLKLVKAGFDHPGKKSALTDAIRMSKFEVLLLTDADCIPSSNKWIQSMVCHLLCNPDIGIVLGYGPCFKNKGLLNLFARYETVLSAMQYMSYANAGIPYMGVGRNLMYKKSLFLKAKGFDVHKHVASGDDDLLISSMATGDNIVVNTDPESFVLSEAKNTLKSYLHQKSRHISTSFYYKAIPKLLLSLFSFVQIVFFILMIIMLVFGLISWTTLFLILVIKWILQIALQRSILQRLSSQDLLYWFPVLDIILPVYLITLSMYALFRKSGW